MPKHEMSESRPGDKVVCELDLASESEFQKLKTLAKDSKFICRDCGRTAGGDESLCTPEWIY